VPRFGIAPVRATTFRNRSVECIAMKVGRLIGRALLVLVDSLAAGAAAAFFAYLFVPVLWVSTRVEIAVVAGATVSAVVLAVALALARLGRRPFPATRAVKVAVDKVPWWI